VAAAFQDSKVGGVPSEQVCLLTGPSATKEHLVSQIEKAIAAAKKDDLLVLYFCGHGHSDDNDFYLCTSNADISQLPATTVSGKELDAVFRRAHVRGILLILDCCHSADFAKHAPEIFRASSGAEFRILLSAAGADELSWEIPGVGCLFTNYLLRVIRGEDIVASDQPGLIYLSNLWHHLQTRIEGEYLGRFSNLPRQTPVQIGFHRTDPLILVNRSLTLQEIAVRTVRYTRGDIYRLIIRAGALICVSVLILAGIVYSYCEHIEFAKSQSNQIIFYRGHPAFPMLGWHQLWSIQTDSLYLREGSPLRQEGGIIISDYDKPVIPKVAAELKPGFRWALLDSPQQQSQIVDDLRSALQDKNLAEAVMEQPDAVEAFANEAQVSDIPLLLPLISPDRTPRIRAAAAAAIITLQPTAAVDFLKNSHLNLDYQFHRLLLPLIRGSCTSEVHGYLSSLMQQQSDFAAVKSQFIDAALRLDCHFTPRELFELHAAASGVSLEEDRGLARFVALQNLQGFWGETISYLRKHRADMAPPLPVGELQILGALPKVSCSEVIESYLDHFWEFTRLAAAEAFLQQCGNPTQKVRAMFSSIPRELLLQMAHQKAVSAGEILTRLSAEAPGDLLDRLTMLKALRQIGDRQAAASVVQYLAADRYDLATRLEAVRTLRALHYSPDAARQWMSDDEDQVRKEAYLWFCEASQEPCKNRLFAEIGNGRVKFLPEILGEFPLSTEEIHLLEAKLRGGPEERRQAAAVLAMRSDAETASDLLRSPDGDIRKSASNYVAYNASFASIVNRVQELSGPLDVRYVINQQLHDLDTFSADVSRTPQWARRWRCAMIVAAREDQPLAPGLALRIQPEIGPDASLWEELRNYP